MPLVAAHDQPARLAAGSRRAATGRASSACRAGGPTASRTRYSCAIGTTGTVTPASAPISPANIPPALTTTSVSIVAPVGLDAGRRARARRRSPVTRVCVLDLRAAPPRALGERERQLARVDVAVGRQVGGAEHAVGRHRREQRLRLGGARSSSSGRPNVFAQPAWRAISSIRSSRRREPERADLAPARLEPDLRPRACGRARRSPSSSASARATPRSWPTRPAEWNVEPLVRSARSTRTTSSQPSRVEPVEDRAAARRRRRSRPPSPCRAPRLLAVALRRRGNLDSPHEGRRATRRARTAPNARRGVRPAARLPVLPRPPVRARGVARAAARATSSSSTPPTASASTRRAASRSRRSCTSTSTAGTASRRTGTTRPGSGSRECGDGRGPCARARRSAPPRRRRSGRSPGR